MTQKKKSNPIDQQTLRRLALLGGGLFAIGLILTAVDWRMGSKIDEDTSINIKGADGRMYITEDTIIKIIRRDTRQDLTDIQIGNLNTKSIEMALKNNPFVLNAEVYIDGRNRIHIDVEQRKPIVRVIDKNNISYYLDIEGAKFPVSNNDVARVPVATGDLSDYRTEEGRLVISEGQKQLYLHQIAKYIVEDEFLQPLIEQIDMDERGNMTLVPKLGHHTIEFGNDERMEEKFRYLKIFYKEALPYQGWEKYSKINLKYAGQVIGTRRGEEVAIPEIPPVDSLSRR
jgi:cell division protein FtsQ